MKRKQRKTSRILIVEDEQIIALGIESILSEIGFHVLGIVQTGEECLEKISSERIDIILMDVRLDGSLDGIETAGIINKKYDIPVIFITAHSDDSTFDRMVPTEHYGHIVKPVSKKELITVINTAIYRHDIDMKLKQNEVKYRTLFEKSRDAIFLCDLNRRFNEVNSAMIEMFGYSQEEFRDLDFYSIFSQRDDAHNFLFMLDLDGYMDNHSVVLKKKDGSEIFCQINSIHLQNEAGSRSLVQGILRDITTDKKMEIEREFLVNILAKRVKELRCLYILSEIIDRPDISFNYILQEMVDVLRESWQYPDITAVRIEYREYRFVTGNFRESEWVQSADIIVDGEKTGTIDVYYLEEKPYLYEGPFHKEERDLLIVIAERLGGIAERFKADEDIIRSRDELRNLTTHLETVREVERTRISREIHDELGQSMTAIKMDISMIEKQFRPDQEDLRGKARQAMNIIDNTIQIVRRISTDLRPGILDDLGLSAAIEWQVRELKNRTDIDFKISCGDVDESITDDHKVMFFRILQEALTNVVRHSHASIVNINLKKISGEIVLEIFDNGIGITGEQLTFSNSCGIIGMRERATSCGGRISITGNRDSGTVVTVVIPAAE